MVSNGDRAGCTAPPKGHLRCPFCGSYEVERLYVGSRAVDCCACVTCGSGWDEFVNTGAMADTRSARRW